MATKYASIEGLTEFIVELRDAGTPWDAQGGIVDQIHADARFTGYTTKSAIPARKLYQEAKNSTKVKPTAKRVKDFRKAGHGWAHIAAKTGATISELKKLAGDSELATGRVYVSGDGSHRVVNLAEVKAAKANAPVITVAQQSAARG